MTRVLVLVLALLAAPWVFAQSYPAKPVRVIVTFPPGGTPDLVVVENRAGAAGMIGTDFVAKAPPDGYTLLFAADATLTPWLYTELPYDPLKDFTPLVNVAAGPFVLLAHPSFKANNVREFIELAKAQPGKIPYASSGAGTQQHLSMETVRAMTGIDVLHIPYKGFGQGFADVLANQVPLIFGGITASISHIKSGKVKGLG